MICYFLILICIVEFIKKHYYISMMIFLFLLLNGFQVVPQEFLTWGFFSGATMDAALFAFLGLLLIRGKFWFKDSIRRTPVGKAVLIFVYYLILNMLYGIIIMRYSFVDTFKSARLYLLVLTIFMFTEIPLPIIMKIIRTIVIVVFVQSILYLLQIYTGKSILQGAREYWMNDLNYERFYNTPILLALSLCICLFWFPFSSFLKKYRAVFIIVLIATVIGPLHRGLIISWFAVIALYALIFNSYLKKSIYLSITFGIGIALDSISIIHNRFADVLDQMSFVSNIFSNKMIEANNDFSYRINHLMERLAYINTHSWGWLFGIGFLDDRAPQAERLPLQYGIADPVHGIIQKVYTPDIAWSLMLLTMGYVGTIIYLNIFLKVLLNYSRNPISYEVSKIIFVIIILCLFTTFESSSITEPPFFVPILMLVVFIEKKGRLLKQSEGTKEFYA